MKPSKVAPLLGALILLLAANDRLASSETKLTASDGARNDLFGLSVALSGDRALVGAVWKDTEAGVDAGAAYIFERVEGSWQQVTRLTASDAAPDDRFGYSVAVSGDYAMVGTFEKAFYEGAAYVFERVEGSWQQVAQLTAADAAPYDEFGRSVAVSGTYAMVSAPEKDFSAGVLYVFERAGGSWKQVTRLTASDAAPADHFGYSVALSGGYAVVGAYGKDTEAGVDAGVVYVFALNEGTWRQAARLTAADAVPDDHFGYSVALSGGYVVVGAQGKDTEAGEAAGAAYVFERNGDSWQQVAQLTASDADLYDLFGSSVAVSSDYAVVGAHSKYTDAGIRAGAAYVFERGEGSWRQVARLTASDASEYDEFGRSVAVSGDYAVIGADFKGTTGAAYVYDLSRLGTGVGVSAEDEAPEFLLLEQNYPNPFNPTTVIPFEVAEAVHVRLGIYDVTGREVARLVDAVMGPGSNQTTWDGRDAEGTVVPSGVYLYRLKAGRFVRTRQMILTR